MVPVIGVASFAAVIVFAVFSIIKKPRKKYVLGLAASFVIFLVIDVS